MTIAAISIITTVTREDARFQQMADAIAGMIPLDHPIHLDWVVVDRYPEDREQEIEDIVDGRFSFTYRDRFTLADGVGMRNVGLEAVAFGSDTPIENRYMIFTDDSTVLTKSTLKVVELAYEKNVGIKFPIKVERNVRVPADGAVAQHESGGLTLVPCPASSVSPGAFGAPMAAFAKIHGFDDVYDDDYDRKSVDAAIRIERAGYSWMTTKRAVAIHMTVGHDLEQEDERKKSAPARDKDNVPHWNALLADRDRFLPTEGEGAEFPVAETVVEAPASGEFELRATVTGGGDDKGPDDPSVTDDIAEEEARAAEGVDKTPEEQAPAAPVAELAEGEAAKFDQSE